MNLEFISRTIKTSLVLSGLLFPFLLMYITFPFALSFVLGSLWGCANLFLLRWLVTNLVITGRKNMALVAIILLVKFPLLYLVGFLMLSSSSLSVYGLLLGFSSIFVVIVLKVLSRSLLKLDSKPAKAL